MQLAERGYEVLLGSRDLARGAAAATALGEHVCMLLLDVTSAPSIAARPRASGPNSAGSMCSGTTPESRARAGKVTNCQIGVSLSIASNYDQVAGYFELHLPEKWTGDAKLRSQRIPERLQFKTKPQLALDMLRCAVEDKLPKGVVLADSAYCISSAFRRAVRDLGLPDAVGVDPQTKIWLLDPKTQLPAAKQDVRSLAYELDRGGGFRRCTWRKGTKQVERGQRRQAATRQARCDPKRERVGAASSFSLRLELAPRLDLPGHAIRLGLVVPRIGDARSGNVLAEGRDTGLHGASEAIPPTPVLERIFRKAETSERWRVRGSHRHQCRRADDSQQRRPGARPSRLVAVCSGGAKHHRGGVYVLHVQLAPRDNNQSANVSG